MKRIICISFLLALITGCQSTLKISTSPKKNSAIPLPGITNIEMNTNPEIDGSWTFWSDSPQIKGKWSKTGGINGGGCLKIDSYKFPKFGTWYKSFKNLEPGLLYFTSIKTNFKNVVTGSPWAGISLTVQYWKKNRMIKDIANGWYSGDSENWITMSLPFKMMPEFDEIRICAFLSAASGTCSFDDFSLGVLDNYPGKDLTKTENNSSLKLASANGFFTVNKTNTGNWYFIDPQGYPFYSLGLNCTSAYGDETLGNNGENRYRKALEKKYKRTDAVKVNNLWLNKTEKKLDSWGFNSTGCWSSKHWKNRRPHVEIIWAGYKGIWDGKVKKAYKGFPDVFSPEFAEYAEVLIKEKCSKYRNDTTLIGYFIDNELHWTGDWEKYPSVTAMDEFLNLPKEYAGKKRVTQFLSENYQDINSLNNELGTKYKSFQDVTNLMNKITPENRDKIAGLYSNFIEIIAERYFSVTTSLIKKYDPDHLILGVRFAYGAPVEVVKICGKYCDVISANIYQPIPDAKYLERLAKISGRPILITEFSHRAEDSGLPNSKGAGTVFKTQSERAFWYKLYITTAASSPYSVGCHYFKWVDQPREGRGNPPDGENSNYGIITIQGSPYTELIEAAKEINNSVYILKKQND